MSLAEGTMLDNRYRVLRPLGEGGFGAAYLVEDQRLRQQRVAKASTVHGTAHREQFESEALMLAELDHPNLPQVYDHFYDRNCPYLVMRYIEGKTLDRLKEGRSSPFEVDQVLRWANDLLEALVYLHSQEPPIIHRDVKPSNVCVTPEGKAVLLDFGIARRLDRTSTHIGAQAHSTYYSPIEQYPAAQRPDGTDGVARSRAARAIWGNSRRGSRVDFPYAARRVDGVARRRRNSRRVPLRVWSPVGEVA